MSKTLRVAGAVIGAGLVTAAFVVAATGFGGTGTPPAAATDLPPATTQVTKSTLTQTETVSGTLGYGTAATVAGRGRGTLTWLPGAGTTVQRGQPVYRWSPISGARRPHGKYALLWRTRSQPTWKPAERFSRTSAVRGPSA